MKPFNEELAKAGAKVISRNKKPARILCFDLKSPVYTIAATVMVEFDGGEEERPHSYTVTGNFYESGTESELDLFMAPEKRYGIMWLEGNGGFKCHYEAFKTMEDAEELLGRSNLPIRVFQIVEFEV